MRIVVINGSARRNMNTAALIEHAAKGAASIGGSNSQVETLQLYPMKYSGCISCLMCKKKGAVAGKCVVNDPLSPILEQAAAADVLIIGTPAYFFRESAGVRCFQERFFFPWRSYNPGMPSRSDKLIPVGLIYSMNVGRQNLEDYGYTHIADAPAMFAKACFGHSEALLVYNTMQVKDYSQYDMGHFNAEMKKANHEQNFEREDCKNAFDLGVRLAQKAVEAKEKGLSPKDQASLARS